MTANWPGDMSGAQLPLGQVHQEVLPGGQAAGSGQFLLSQTSSSQANYRLKPLPAEPDVNPRYHYLTPSLLPTPYPSLPTPHPLYLPPSLPFPTPRQHHYDLPPPVTERSLSLPGPPHIRLQNRSLTYNVNPCPPQL